MPRPKDPKRVEEWKRKIGEQSVLAKKRGLQVVSSTAETLSNTIKIKKDMDLANFTENNILQVHGKLHIGYKYLPTGWSVEDIVSLHSNVVSEMSKKNLKHISYDDLDEIHELTEEVESNEQ